MKDLKPLPILTVYFFITRGLIIIFLISSLFLLSSPLIFNLFFNPMNKLSIYNSIFAVNVWILSGIAISLIISFIYSNSLRKSFRLKVLKDYIYFKSGVLVKKEVLIPFESLKTTQSSQNFLEKMLKISRIKIHFNDSSIEFPGLEKGFEVASEILSLKH